MKLTVTTSDDRLVVIDVDADEIVSGNSTWFQAVHYQLAAFANAVGFGKL